jgi:hypothetical protein
MMPASLALGRMTGLVSARPAIVKIEMCNSEHAHSSTLTLLQRHSLKENTNKAHTADYILRERLFFSMPQKQRLSSVVCVAPTSQRPAVDEGATTFPLGVPYLWPMARVWYHQPSLPLRALDSTFSEGGTIASSVKLIWI